MLVYGRDRTLDQVPRDRPARRLFVAACAVLALSLWLLLGVRPAGADDGVRQIIAERAEAHGVSVWLLTEIVRCESNFDPSAVGDRGRSHGLAQLNDLPGTGLLWDFYARGYRSPYSAWESADYLASVAAGELPGIRLSRWSCYRRLA